MSKQIEAQDGWPIGKVAEFLNLSKSTLYIWSCYDRWGGKYPPAPKRIGRRLVWDPREVIIVGDGVEVVGVSFDGFFIHLSSSLCSYHFVVVYKMMGGQCFQRFEPI